MLSNISYVTQFARATPTSYTQVITNGTTHLAKGHVTETTAVRPRTANRPSGVKVDYDGTADAPTILGTLTQDILIKNTSGVDALFDTLFSRLANYATLTAVKKSGATVTCGARMIVCDDSPTPDFWNTDTRRRVRLVFDLQTEWA